MSQTKTLSVPKGPWMLTIYYLAVRCASQDRLLPASGPHSVLLQVSGAVVVIFELLHAWVCAWVCLCLPPPHLSYQCLPKESTFHSPPALQQWKTPHCFLHNCSIIILTNWDAQDRVSVCLIWDLASIMLKALSVEMAAHFIKEVILQWWRGSYFIHRITVTLSINICLMVLFWGESLWATLTTSELRRVIVHLTSIKLKEKSHLYKKKTGTFLTQQTSDHGKQDFIWSCFKGMSKQWSVAKCTWYWYANFFFSGNCTRSEHAPGSKP